jgi:hypothetical protein
MSKALSNDKRIHILKIYRSILKIHEKKLNNDMRIFGDYFVKSEFNMHYHSKTIDNKQISLFINNWEKYLIDLSSQKSINKIELDDSLHTKMDIDQMKTMNTLKDLIKSN